MLRDLGRCLEATDTFRESIDAALMAGDRWQEGTSRNFLATGLLSGETAVQSRSGMPKTELVRSIRSPDPGGPVGSSSYYRA